MESCFSESFQAAAKDAVEILESEMAIPIDLTDTEGLVRVASTALNSKVVSQYSSLLAPIAVQAVMKVKDNYVQNNVDLKDIKIVRKLGGTLDDTGKSIAITPTVPGLTHFVLFTELIEGLCLAHRFCNDFGSKRVEKAKIGLIQFQISPPKTDMDNQARDSDSN